jgi:uncharacterized membrane protein YeaQ/YmgE (transglycosylase-associated protein family)
MKAKWLNASIWSTVAGIVGAVLLNFLSSDAAATAATGSDYVAAFAACTGAAALAFGVAMRKKG